MRLRTVVSGRGTKEKSTQLDGISRVVKIKKHIRKFLCTTTNFPGSFICLMGSLHQM